jgi:DEAD/DEAH box helicase domain-containing protein
MRLIEPVVGEREGAGAGYAHIVRAVPGFKKVRFGTHENIGFGAITLPDLELHTSAAYWPVPGAVASALADPVERATAALGAAHAIHHVAAMVLMCDVRDLGHAVTAGHAGGWAIAIDSSRTSDAEAMLQASGVPWIHLYDNMPGGAGLSPRAHALGAALLERVIEAVQGCSCERGCPTCVGNQAPPPAGIAEGFALRPAVLTVLTGLRDMVSP